MAVNGTCIITSQAKGATIGVDYNAERTPTPKKVIVLPEGLQPCKWEVETSADGNGVIITINKKYIAVIDGLVYAIMVDGPPPAIWKINQVNETTHCLVTLADNPTEGWDISAEAGDQIAIKPLNATSTQVFAITPAD